MRTMCPNSIPVFLGNAGIGLPHGMVPPQIRGFDVFYKTPILVGFHVVGSQENICPDMNFISQEILDELAPKIVGFYAIGTQGEVYEEPSLVATLQEDENAPKIVGFYAYSVSTINSINFLPIIVENIPNSPKIVGFYCIGVT